MIGAAPPEAPEAEAVAAPAGRSGLGAAEMDALGSRARVVVWPAHRLPAAMAAVAAELARLDMQASRFREDSELSRIRERGAGVYFVSPGLAEAIEVALAASRFTDGLVDPTVGSTLVALGYDRDFTDMMARPAYEPNTAGNGRGSVFLEGRLLSVSDGLVLDLGATGKGLGADRAARSALAACGAPSGVLVSLGGDISVAGEPPVGGWPVLVSESPVAEASGVTQLVRISTGGIATSSTCLRSWRQGPEVRHHIVDPRTGFPAVGRWRTATVVAASCAEANAAATAAIVAGEAAIAWLTKARLPARLVSHDGEVVTVGQWPGGQDEAVEAPPSRMRTRPLAAARP